MVVTRDIVIFIGLIVVFLPKKFPVVSPSYLGKFTTFSQAITLLVVMSEGVPVFRGVLYQFLNTFIYLTAVFTALSFVQYIFRGVAMLKEKLGTSHA
jgi:phosphatidylglycerophosphate synthase